jgi:hypothetical protein
MAYIFACQTVVQNRYDKTMSVKSSLENGEFLQPRYLILDYPIFINTMAYEIPQLIKARNKLYLSLTN